MIKKALKYAAVVLASAVLAVTVTSCGETGKKDSGKKTSEESSKKEDKKEEDKKDDKKDDSKAPADSADYVDMKTLYEAMLAADPDYPEMSVLYGEDEMAKEAFFQVADFDYDKVEDFFFAFSSNGSAEEFSVIVVKDEADAAHCEDGFAAALHARVDTLETYAPDQVPMTKDARIFSEGRYVVMIVGSHQDDVQEAFEAAIKQ